MAAGQFPGPGTSREWSPRIAVGAIFRMGNYPPGASLNALNKAYLLRIQTPHVTGPASLSAIAEVGHRLACEESRA
jgi:hypothetical protein